MTPEWLKEDDCYVPPKDGGTFLVKTIKTMGQTMSRIRVQRGHEKMHALPALLKLIVLIVSLIVLSVSRNVLIILGFMAAVQVYLSTWRAGHILYVLKPSAFGALLTCVLLMPAMIMNPDGITNNFIVVLKVFVSLEMVSIFNHTTQWNHMTEALKRLHVPGIFIFTLDITLKYIVLLGQLIVDMLISLSLRSVGKNNRKYQSVGGVMGVTFLRGGQMSREMYEAMRCRGFTDDYKGL